MQYATSKRRRAFSLLEMVLALAIGMLLLLALYVAFNTYIISAQTGRDAVTEATIARNVLTRISQDIRGQIGPDDPRVVTYPNPTAQNPNGMQTSSQPMVKFNTGVYGPQDRTDQLILSGFRVRKPPPGAVATLPDSPANSDLSRTIYWIVTDGAKSSGLARKEITQATSNDIELDPTSLPDQQSYLIAPEVKKIEFSFNNGNGSDQWSSGWDGETPLDNGLPPGPPTAIKIVLTLRRNLKTADDPDGDADGPIYTQIVALPTSNNFPPATTAP